VHPIKDGAPELWSFVQKIIEDSVMAGYLSDEPEDKSAEGYQHIPLPLDANQ
jgi:hypothetical protein